MAITVESLLIKIDADVASLNTKLDKAMQKSEKAADSFGKKFTKVAAKVGTEMARMGKLVFKWATYGTTALLALGKLGAEAGRGLSEGGDYAAAAYDRLGYIFRNVTKGIAEGLAPALHTISVAVEEGIASFGGMEAIIAKVREGARYAIKIMGDGWQGLGIIIQGFKISLASIAVSWAWVQDKVVSGLDWIYASFDVTGAMLKKAWAASINGIVMIFGAGVQEVAKATIALGNAMTNGGVKGADKVIEMGNSMFTAMGGVMASTARTSAAAGDVLDEKVRAMEIARDAMINGTKGGNESIARTTAELARLRAELQTTTDSIEVNGSLGTQLQQKLDAITDAQRKEFVIRTNHLTALQKMEEDFAKQQIEWSTARYLGETQMAAISSHNVLRVQAEMYAEQQKMQLERNSDAVLSEERLNLEIQRVQMDQYREDRDMQMKTLALWKSGARGKLEVMGNFFSTLTPLMESNSRKQFEIGKAAAIAETIVNTYSAAMAAFKSMAGIPYVGYALGAAAAASVVATGLRNIQQIRGTQFGGGGGGAPATPPAAPTAQAGAAAGGGGGPTGRSNVNVTLVGNRFDAGQVRGLIDSINDQVDDNAKIKVRSV